MVRFSPVAQVAGVERVDGLSCGDMRQLRHSFTAVVALQKVHLSVRGSSRTERMPVMSQRRRLRVLAVAAGFQVSAGGRIWVSTKAVTHRKRVGRLAVSCTDAVFGVSQRSLWQPGWPQSSPPSLRRASRFYALLYWQRPHTVAFPHVR